MPTDAEKTAEALKAADAARSAEAVKRTDETKKAAGVEDDKEEPEEKSYTAEAYKKVAAEAKQRRLENKALSEQVEKFNKALEVLTGKKDAGPDPLEAVKAGADKKMRNALMRSSLATVARDAHDSSLLYKSFPEAFAEVDADVDAETVDEEALGMVVAKLRKSKPFLFQAADGKDKAPLKSAPLALDGKGAPAGGENERAVWNKMLAAGNTREAGQYYAKHAATIRNQIRD